MMSNTPFNPIGSGLGSAAALSLASNPAALITLAAVGGVVVTVAAATFTYKAYEDYVEKKHKKLILDINDLHNRYLARISIPDNHEIQGFPPPFKLDRDAPSSTVDSMHFTDDQIKDFGKTMSQCPDIILSTYRESIKNAMLELKAFYFKRKDHHDVTSGVIAYLLHLLDTKCMNFQGYDYDIAYLEALSRFINAYASMNNSEKTRHFSRLNPVYAYLQTAKQDLERHKAQMSLEGMFTELRDACIARGDMLIKQFTKLITDDEHWHLIDMAPNDLLVQGLIRRKYIDKEIWGIVFKSDHKTKIPQSLFQNWVKQLAKYYLETLDPETRLVCGDIKPPSELFRIPDLARLKALRESKESKKKLTREESAELAALEREFKGLRDTFSHCRNFITTKLDPETINDDRKFIPVTSDEDVYERAMMLQKFALLIHQIISVQYFCTHLLKSLKQLGEIYVKNPKHFGHAFNVLSNLCKYVEQGVTENMEDFTKIQLTNRNAMQLRDQELLPLEIKNIMEAARATISRLYKQIVTYRDRVPKNKLEELTKKSVKNEMFQVAALLADFYGIKGSMRSPCKILAKSNAATVPSVLLDMDHEMVSLSESHDEPVNEMHANTTVPPLAEPASSSSSSSSSSPSTVIKKTDDLNEQLDFINNQLQELVAASQKTPLVSVVPAKGSAHDLTDANKENQPPVKPLPSVSKLGLFSENTRPSSAKIIVIPTPSPSTPQAASLASIKVK